MSNGEAFEALIASRLPFEFKAVDYEQNECNDRYGFTGRNYLCRVGADTVLWQSDRVPSVAITRALTYLKEKE